MKKFKTVLTIILVFVLATFTSDLFSQDSTYTYAYISVSGKIFSKKLKVEVDFGDTDDQIKVGEEYTEILTNKKSYAAVLNYMVQNNFELVETLEYTYSYNGTGGTSGIAFIMRKKL